MKLSAAVFYTFIYTYTVMPRAAQAVIRDISELPYEEPRALRGGNPFEDEADAPADGMSTYIITFSDDDGDRGKKAEALAKAFGGTVGAVYRKVLNGASLTIPATAAAGLAKSPGVALAEEEMTYHALAVDATKYTWGQDRIDQCPTSPLSAATFSRQDASDVKVYIFDTGIHPDHEDFTTSNLIDAADPCNQSYLTRRAENMPADSHGHGTHVASTVCGDKYGVVTCGAGKLCAVQVLDRGGSGSTTGILAGLDASVIDCTTNHGSKCVGNMSLGGGGVQTSFINAVNAASAAGLTMIVAAGNSNADACGYSPAAATGAITVGATDSNDNLASFTNWGPCVDIFGPGVSVTAASISTSGTNTWSGTSMASPHVAALAAAARQTETTYSFTELENTLRAATTMNDVDCRYPGTGVATIGTQLGCSTTMNTCPGGPTPPSPSPPSPTPPPPAPTCRSAGQECMMNNCESWSGCQVTGGECCCCSGLTCGGSGRLGTCL